jgi:hypothetical protein
MHAMRAGRATAQPSAQLMEHHNMQRIKHFNSASNFRRLARCTIAAQCAPARNLFFLSKYFVS